LSKDDQGLLATPSLQFERREISGDLKFLALVNNVGGNGHRIIVFAEVRSIDVIDLKQILDQAA